MRPAGSRSSGAQFLRFALVGFVGFIVNGGIVFVLAPHTGPLFAQLAAFPAAATATWLLNRRYTFGASPRPLWQEWGRYIAANGVGWLANNGVYVLAVELFPAVHGHPVFAVAAGSVAGALLNFGGSKLALS